jgi:hypothetical protein
LRVERLREKASDRREEAALAHPLERRVAIAQGPRGSGGIAGEHLHHVRLKGANIRVGALRGAG